MTGNRRLPSALARASVLAATSADAGAGAASLDKTKSLSFSDTLVARLSQLHLAPDELDLDAVKAAYARACLDCLIETQQAIEALAQDASGAPAPDDREGADADEDVDGARDRLALETLLPIVVCWGIAPGLDAFASAKAVQGFRMGRTSASAGKDQQQQQQQQGPDAEAGVPTKITDPLLFTDCVVGLVQLALSSHGLFLVDLLRRRHLAQIMLCALSVQEGVLSQQLLSAGSGGLSADLVSNCAVMIEDAPARFGTRLCMEALLFLLSSPPRGLTMPAWLGSAVGLQLSRLVVRPDGVMSLCAVLLPMDGEEAEVSQPNITHMEQIARLLLAPPSKMSKQVYYSAISAQLRDILASPELHSKRTTMAASFVIVRCANSKPKIAAALFVNPIIAPLVRFYMDLPSSLTPSSAAACSAPGEVISSDTDIQSAILTIERLIAGNEPSYNLMQSMADAIPPIYFMLEQATLSKLAVRSSLSQILTAFFRLSDPSDSSSVLCKICFGLLHQRTADVHPSSSGSLELRVPETIDPALHSHKSSRSDCDFLKLDRGSEPSAADVESGRCADLEALVAFLGELQHPTLVGVFFLAVLEGTLRLQRSQGEDDDDDEEEEGDNSKVNDDGRGQGVDAAVLVARREREEMQHAATILALMNRFGDALLKNTRQVLQFVRSLLVDADGEGLHLALTLLKDIFSSDDLVLDQETRSIVADIRIILQTLMSHSDATIHSLSRDIRMLIISRLADDAAAANTPFSDTGLQPSAQSLQDFREALKELSDELLPVRARGMAILRRLVLAQDPIAVEHLESIITIFLDMLDDEDTYIYLNAIKGLSALTDVFAQQTLKRFATRYMDAGHDLSLDYRLRLGEALMQTIQRCGQVFPKHASVVMPALMAVLRDSSNEMRSSALSLLSRVAEVAPLALLPFIEQITDYLLSVLQLDKEPVMRRGAVVTISSLLRSLQGDARRVLSVRRLQTIRQRLVITESSDADALTRQHAQDTLEDLDVCLQMS
ncbi:hypothetical protein BC831DRAFT_471970 [Entophlyctis helioformis]|nr:hypothetical protein BC831DRAFT_471970 [Entophlyctis helioformis]